MRKRIVVVCGCALAVVALGSAPRMLEELRVGGGYGDVVDGGLDVDHEGNVTTDGDVAIDGALETTGLGTFSSGLRVNGGAIGTDADPDTLSLHNGYATVNGFLNATTAFVAGIEDTTAGQLTVFGDDAEEGGRIIFNPGADYDTNTGRWDIGVPEDTEDWCLRAEEDPVVSVDGTSHTVTLSTDLLVDGGEIGLTTDEDLLALDNSCLSVNGTLCVGKALWAGGRDPAFLAPATDGIALAFDGGMGLILAGDLSDGEPDKPVVVLGPAFCVSTEGFYVASSMAEFQQANSEGDSKTAFGLAGSLTDSTAGSEDGKLSLGVMHGGTLATDRFTVDDEGTGLLAGDLAVNGGDIGTTGDPDVLHLSSGAVAINGSATLGSSSTDAVTCVGRMVVRKVNDLYMDETPGTEAEIVLNTADETFYGCTCSGNPASWVVLGY